MVAIRKNVENTVYTNSSTGYSLYLFILTALQATVYACLY